MLTKGAPEPNPTVAICATADRLACWAYGPLLHHIYLRPFLGTALSGCMKFRAGAARPDDHRRTKPMLGVSPSRSTTPGLGTKRPTPWDARPNSVRCRGALRLDPNEGGSRGCEWRPRDDDVPSRQIAVRSPASRGAGVLDQNPVDKHISTNLEVGPARGTRHSWRRADRHGGSSLSVQFRGRLRSRSYHSLGADGLRYAVDYTSISGSRSGLFGWFGVDPVSWTVRELGR